MGRTKAQFKDCSDFIYLKFLDRHIINLKTLNTLLEIIALYGPGPRILLSLKFEID